MVAVAAIITISTIVVKGAAVSALVAFAIGLLVLALAAHPVLVAARVFPVVVLEVEAAASLGIELSCARAIVESAVETLVAGLVVTIAVVIVVLRPGLSPGHAAAGQRNGYCQGCKSEQTSQCVAHRHHLSYEVARW